MNIKPYLYTSDQTLPFPGLCGILASQHGRHDEKEGHVGQLFLSLAQLAAAIILSALIAYLAFYLFQWLSRGLDEWQELRQGNAAVGIVLGSILVAVSIVLRPALSLNTTTWDVGSAFLFRALVAQALQLAVGLLLAVLTLMLGFLLFAALTRGIDEIDELRKGNLAVAGLMAGVVIGMGLMVSEAVAKIMTLVSTVLF
jgi:uncharacterized membrane protein YjfL (UPF0719 family)